MDCNKLRFRFLESASIWMIHYLRESFSYWWWLLRLLSAFLVETKRCGNNSCIPVFTLPRLFLLSACVWGSVVDVDVFYSGCSMHIIYILHKYDTVMFSMWLCDFICVNLLLIYESKCVNERSDKLFVGRYNMFFRIVFFFFNGISFCKRKLAYCI